MLGHFADFRKDVVMLKPVTLHVYDTRELRIAKNFVILGFLFTMLDIIIRFSFANIVLQVIVSLVSLAVGIIGFYKISKLARSITLFRNFSLSTFVNLVNGVILTLGIQEVLKSFLFLPLMACNIYWLYKFFTELSVLSGDNFFINGFKISCFALVLLFIGIFDANRLVLIASMLVVLVGFGCILIGAFRLKQITYFISDEGV